MCVFFRKLFSVLYNNKKNNMSGGLMQIVARGAQDKYLSVDPEITFWKTMHRRHTNFAMESIEQTFNGSVSSNGKVSATISRNGDLVHRVWLEIDLPGTGGAIAGGTSTSTSTGTRSGDETVYDAIDNISIEIGGTRCDRHYGAWMKYWDELSCPAGKRGGLDSLVKVKKVDAVDTATATQKLRVPLSFWFCREAGQALPLIALQYHEVKINVEFNSLEANTKASLWVDYIYLDTEERQRFARSGHEYLIEQVQTTGAESTGATSSKIRLNFNHPVKELVWVHSKGVQTFAKLQLNGHDRFAKRDAAYFSHVQRYQHHTASGSAAAGVAGTINMYSFALEPEKLQPSGTCNFSRIDNATLHLEGTGMDGSTSGGGTATVYATNYNVLRIKNGMGGLAYSN